MLVIEQAQYRVSDFRLFTVDNLVINSGESWAFVGSNGSGKTLLTRVLCGELLRQRGYECNTFKSIARLSLEQLQQLIAQEWQRDNTDLLGEDENEHGRTAAEIIQDSVADPDTCKQLAAQFGISHLLSRPFKHLSTGETRKVMLCQLLMAKPDMIVLDEPYDGLDVPSREQLTALLHLLWQQGVTLILVVNRFDQIPVFVQHVGVLADCELVKAGERSLIVADETVKLLSVLDSLTTRSLPPADVAPVRLAPEVPRIVLNNGVVTYHDKAIIHGLNWQVNADEHWQITGPNGAGKSTLLSLVTGDHPQGYCNDLTLFGRRRGSGETIWDIKQHIGFVSSRLHLDYRVSSSVINVLISGYVDSIGLYRPISDRQRTLATQWLQLLGLETKRDQPFSALSFGQQRLVLIARALVKHPTLLILDEPLQGLDSLNRAWVKVWVDKLIAESRSQLLFVSHHQEDAPRCITHRLNFIQNGAADYQYKVENLR